MSTELRLCAAPECEQVVCLDDAPLCHDCMAKVSAWGSGEPGLPRFPVWLTESELELVKAMLSQALDMAQLIQCSTIDQLDRFRRLRDRFRNAEGYGPAQTRSKLEDS